MVGYHQPRDLREALAELAASSCGAACYAGGTDLLPRWSQAPAEGCRNVVDLKRIEALKGISDEDGEVRVGACTSMSELESDPLIRAAAPVLANAANRVACPQIRNRATIGGNLCNASPAADTAGPLILLDAVLDVARFDRDTVKMREVAVADFFKGPGATVLVPGEVLVRIRFRPLPDGTFAAWEKLGTRPAMEIAVASVGVAIRFEEGEVTHARLAYGSVAPIPLRGREAEAELIGHPLSTRVIERCEAAARGEIDPITDVRASAAYRREMVAVLLRRMLERAAHE